MLRLITSTKAVASKIKSNYTDLNEYDELVNAWSQLCEQAMHEPDGEASFSDVESAALAALSETRIAGTDGKVGYQTGRILNAFVYPAFMVDPAGEITTSNISAWKEYGLTAQASVDRLPYKTEGGETVGDVIRSVAGRRSSDAAEILLKRVATTDKTQQATLAVTGALEKQTPLLVFLIPSKWKVKSRGMLVKQYKLTRAEADVLMSLVEGFTTKEIAQQRSRSHETIRAQLQSIREKAGAKNQTELIRTTLSLSDFESNLQELKYAIKHPYRRQIEVLSHGRRRVELTLMGDHAGVPLVTIANATNYTFNAEIEKALYDQGMCIVSICTPGCGKTDLPPEGQSRNECLAADVETVLDQLNVDSAMMLAYNANSPMCYKIVNHIPERFYHLAHVSAPVPVGFIKKIDTQSSWVNGILKAGTANPAMKALLFKGAMKALVTLGAEKYFKLQLSSNPVEADIVFKPENLVEYDHAISVVAQSGVANAAEDIAQSFDDWTAEVENLPVRITIIQGVEDSLYTIQNVRDFAASFSLKTTMIEVRDAGFPVIQTHPELVCSHLRSLIEKYGKSLSVG